MPKKKSISVIVPALNEQEKLEAAIETVKASTAKHFEELEILIFNDGSTDRTGEIADKLAKADPRIKVTHHDKPKNLGAVYKAGVKKATKEFLIMIPGDNENPPSSIEPVLAEAGNAEIIVPYTTNQHARPLLRRILSNGFVTLLNTVSGCHLRYYNGTVLHRVDLVKAINIETDSFGYQAELLIKLLKRKHSFKEVPIEISVDQAGRKSRALNVKNFATVGKFLLAVAFDRQFKTPSH